ncbi:glycosyltransferase family 2 protein [Pseudochrobactrum kiredjianiae]|uniref:Glycosyltransferase family 2 protein n=1 Tax=Pseudochrobactrum kiredjianiae TaxID=386305 RepID=A0ABW3V3P3_9HYPH|nr:glycosyltransferase family A protein [Pseudochrobactrum kiredjianiae]MDM7853281.1 glycosyltransferase family A protein [Pseudochrobactrum kiredjianiae]
MEDITVVIPAHNAAKTIERALSSIPRYVRVIVIIDGTTDDTGRLANTYSNVSVIVNDKSVGAAHARNIGLEKVSTEFVTFLDADDYIVGDLHRGMAQTLSATYADAVFSPWGVEQGQSFQMRGSLGALRPVVNDRTALLIAWLRGNGCLTGSVGWRTAFLRSIGGWANVRKAQDYEIGIRTIIKGARFTCSDQGCLVYVDHVDPNRISRIRSSTVIDDQISILAQAKQFANDCSDPKSVRKAIGVRYYLLALSCFQEGERTIGRDLLFAARSLGFSGHIGTPLSRLVSYIIGAEAKVTVAKKARCIKKLHRS